MPTMPPVAINPVVNFAMTEPATPVVPVAMAAFAESDRTATAAITDVVNAAAGRVFTIVPSIMAAAWCRSNSRPRDSRCRAASSVMSRVFAIDATDWSSR